MLINKKAVRTHVKELRPGLRVSARYLAALNSKVAEAVESDVRVIGGRKTLTGAVIRHCDKFNAAANVKRRKAR